MLRTANVNCRCGSAQWWKPCQDSWLLLQGWNPRQKGYQITRVWLRWPSGKFPNDYENTTNTRVVKNICTIFHDNTWWVARDRKVFAYTHNCMRAHIYIYVCGKFTHPLLWRSRQSTDTYPQSWITHTHTHTLIGEMQWMGCTNKFHSFTKHTHTRVAKWHNMKL